MVQVFAGTNYFSLKQALNAHIDEFKQKNGDLAVESFDGQEAELADIQTALQSVSLFAPQKLVVVKGLSANSQVSENIEQLINSTSENSELLLVEPKPDKRSTYYKILKKKADLKEYSELDEHKLAEWAVEYADGRGAKLSRADANYLIARVGAVQIVIHNEIQKLVNYSPDITRQNIDALTTPNPQHTFFELLEAVYGGNTRRALELYRLLRQSGSQPPVIIAMFVWQMHQICLVAYADSRSIDEIAADTGSKTFPLQKSQRIARELGPANIKMLMDKLESLDYRLKTESLDPDEAVEAFIIKVATSS